MNEEEIQYITFKQFFYTINIRNCYGNDIQDNQIIRLVYGLDERDYIEIGWYDFYNKDYSWEILEKTLNKNIIDSIVTGIRYEEKFNTIFLYLSAKEDIKETLREYTN